jgi:hypothetical protein
VANDSQGFAVTWNGVTLGEVVSVSVDGMSADVVEVTPRNAARASGKVYSAADVDFGSVTVVLRSGSGMQITNVGLTGSLSISGPGASWSFGKTIFESLGWTAAVGELQQHQATFKIGA